MWMLPLGVLWVIAAALGALPTVGAVQGDGQRILWGQCTSYCLRRHQDKIQSRQTNKALKSHTSPDKVILCRKSRECRWCLFACDRPGDLLDHAACHHDCQNPPEGRHANEDSCKDSCDFLARALTNKTGRCPVPGSATHWEAACLRECQSDDHCSSYKKCCPNSCGRTCQKPEGLDELLPPQPRHMDFVTRKDGGVLVTWGSKSDHAPSLPVVSILTWWCPYSRHPQFHITQRDSVKVHGYPAGIHPGEQCSYIVAAVNEHGSFGFTKVHHFVKKITKPSEPVNFQLGRMQESRDRVSVKLEWQPPRVSDLDVWRYTVLWGYIPAIQPIYTSIHMNKKSIPGSRLSYTLKNLRPGTTYFVQVRPVVKWRDRRMRGEPASMYLKTISKPQPGTGSTMSPPYGRGAQNSPIFDIKAQQAIFHEGVLKANITWETDNKSKVEKFMIYWKPESCQGPQTDRHVHFESQATSHEPWFRLYNLRYACQYAVRIHPVNRRGRVLDPAVKRFRTPACAEIQTTGPVRPDCPKQITLPGRPEGLKVEVKPRGCGVAALVQWGTPSPSDVIESYVLLLGESEATSASHVVYVSQPRRHNVSASSRRLEVGGLQGDRHYSVQVRATTRGGDGPAVLVHFNTPSVVDCITPSPPSSHSTSSASPKTKPTTTAKATTPTSLATTLLERSREPQEPEPTRNPSQSSTVSPSTVSPVPKTSGNPISSSPTPKGSVLPPSRTHEPSRRPAASGVPSASRGNGNPSTRIGREWLELWVLTLSLAGLLRWTLR